MRRYALGLILALLTGIDIQAQVTTTVVNFDTPACSGNVIKIYQGIDFSLSPWDCERPTMTGDATETISWYQKISTAKFRFVNPSILVSIRVGSSASNGSFTVETDAAETFTGNISGGRMGGPFITNFSKPASVVTVTTTVSWTIEVDDITYKTGAVLPASITISPTVATIPIMPSLTFTDVVENSSSNVSWSATCGSITQAGVYTPPPTIPIGETCTITAALNDDQTKTSSAVVTIGRATAPLIIVTASLPNGVVGTAYSATLVASGGKAPYTWSIASGALPVGLILSSSGTISGLPTVAGLVAFTVQVMDSTGGLARGRFQK